MGADWTKRHYEFTEKKFKKSVMLLLGIDLGSSSVKASVIEGETGKCLATAFYPSDEMEIIAVKPGWAEQDTGNLVGKS